MAIKKIQYPPALGRLLNTATSACNAMAQEMLEPHGLSLPQWVILSALLRCDDLLVSEIAEFTGNATPAVSRILDRMEDKGLVSRSADPGDRRGVRVGLTDKSRELEHLRDFWADVNDRLLDGFTPEQVAMLFELLQRVEHNARSAAGKTAQR